MNKTFLIPIMIMLTWVNAAWSINSRLALNSEQVIFSFVVNEDQVVSVCISEDESYMVCRYGKPDQLILQFPPDSSLNQSWDLFYYEYYLRGGGVDNAGLDLNYLYFEDQYYQYMIYQEYSAEDNTNQVGMIITDKIFNLEETLIGDPETVEGDMLFLRKFEFSR